MRLSAGVQAAWQFGASETIRGKHQFIEKEQVLIGIFSLEKAVAVEDSTELDPFAARSLLVENNEIEGLLREFGLDQTAIRRCPPYSDRKSGFHRFRKNCSQERCLQRIFQECRESRQKSWLGRTSLSGYSGSNYEKAWPSYCWSPERI